MALDFPASPSVGQVFPAVSVTGAPQYVWDGNKWTQAITTGGGGGGTAAATSFVPVGEVAATNVQTAIAEVDAEKVSIAGDMMTGTLGIGMPPITASPQNYLLNISNQINYEFDVGEGFFELDVFNSDPGTSPVFYLGRSRGTISASTAVANGDSLGGFSFFGRDTVDWAYGGSIGAEVDGVVGAGSVPLALTFYTGSTGGGSERLRIASNGKVKLTSPVAIVDADQVTTKLYVDTQVATRAPLATISTLAPSGGVDGDVWYQVT